MFKGETLNYHIVAVWKVPNHILEFLTSIVKLLGHICSTRKVFKIFESRELNRKKKLRNKGRTVLVVENVPSI